MVHITAAEGTFLTNGAIYVSGTLYLPAEADAAAWSEVDSVVEDKALTSEEVLQAIFGGAGEVRESTAREVQETLSTIQTLGGIKTETAQSDKLGYDYKNVYVGEVLVRQEYVEQEVKTGTEDNPIVYAEGVPLINNAYYLKDGKKYVWMEEWVEWGENSEV